MNKLKLALLAAIFLAPALVKADDASSTAAPDKPAVASETPKKAEGKTKTNKKHKRHHRRTRTGATTNTPK